MDRPHDGVTSDSFHDDDVCVDEMEVADTLTRLESLITLSEFRNHGFLPPLWGTNRLRTACAADLQRAEPVVVVAAARPVVSCGSNLRNMSPDSPLFLKDSPTSGGEGQGIPGIVLETPREKEVNNIGLRKDDVGDSTGTETSKRNPQKEETERRNVKRARTESEDPPVHVDFGRTIPGQLSVSLVTRDLISESDPLPNGRSMPLFDLNLTPPDCSGIPSPLPDVCETPCPPPSDGELEVRQKMSHDTEGEIPPGCFIGNQGAETIFRQVQ